MPKRSDQIKGSGTARIVFDTPRDPFDVSVYSLVPFNSRVKSVEVMYVTIPVEVASSERAARMKSVEAKLKRHAAAVKVNATRKAKKEAANG